MGNVPLSVPPQAQRQQALAVEALRRWGLALVLGFALLLMLWPLPAWGLSAEGNSAQEVAGGGARLFANHCAACHINGGNIIRRSQTLKLKALERRGLASAEAIAMVAANGLGQMGGYGEALGPGGAEAVGAWVWEQAQKAWIQG